MNIEFVRYDPATGRVRGVGNCDHTDYALNRALYPGDAFLVGHADLDTDYVNVSADPHVIAPRPALGGFGRLEIAADDADTARLAHDGPFTVTIDGAPHTIDTPDETGAYVLEITAAIPAEYRVAVEAWPALPYEATITAS
jgi:hypothetical protein